MIPSNSATTKQSAEITVAQRRWRATLVWLSALTGLILCGVVRSSLATRLDSFTIDEPWHITAGVSYVQTGDFRLNPEHPPLVKLWVGMLLTEDVFRLPPFRTLQDKPDERDFVDDAVYLQNDAAVIQRRARLAMLSFHAVLLLAFTLAAQRVFGMVMALAVLAFLVVDPTVAAHMPVVMTDLSLALLSSTALLLGIVAFRSWRLWDLALVMVALGLVLGVKHSGLITFVGVAGFGSGMAMLGPVRNGLAGRVRRLASVTVVMVGSLIILWSFYGFRFHESQAGLDLFNRPLADKLSDIRSPLYQETLRFMVHGHLLPRAYIWGLADIIRVGIEGRSASLYFFGKHYDSKTPWYFSPGVLLVKLPLGLLALAAAGMTLMCTRQCPRTVGLPLYTILAFVVLFLVFLARSRAGYAGVRHALVVVPPMAMLGALALKTALARNRRVLRGFVLLAGLAALVSALPVMRPWEYYNELVGGAQNAWRYCNDEGLDLRQRTTELIRYYDEHIRGTEEAIYDEYGISDEQKTRHGLKFWSWQDDLSDSDLISGTVFISAKALSPEPIYDYAALRQAQPVTRFGNLLVFRGTFHFPWLRATNRLARALEILSSEQKDVATAERLLTESITLYPQDYRVALELGNLLAARGARQEAIHAYELARSNAPRGDKMVDLLTRQIDRITVEPSEQVPPLRNAWLE